MRCMNLAALILLLPQTGRAAPTTDWPAGLAHFLSTPDVLTNNTLAGALAPAIQLDDAGCQTARLPGSASTAPVSTSVIAYEDDQACNQPTRLVLLEFSLAAQPDVFGRFYNTLRAMLPAPCFSGDLPPDQRRHAPVRHLLAWKLPGRTLTIGTQANDPDDFSVALLQTGQTATPPAGTPAKQVKQDFLRALPLACQ